MLIASLVLLTVLIAQTFRIQGIDAASVSSKGLQSRLDRESIPALRGNIEDASGAVLARSVDRRDIYVDATLARAYQVKVDGHWRKVGLAGAAKDIAKVLGAEPADLLGVLSRASAANRKFAYLAKDVSPDQWRRVAELEVPGVGAERVIKRVYPQGTGVAPVIGWLGANGQPGGGVELMEQKQLNGVPGQHIFERALDGTAIATGDHRDVPAKPGADVRLTLDSDLQWYAANAVAQAAKKEKAKSATAVIMSVKTGEILAAAQSPSYDNNHINSADTAALQTRPFTHPYEPGSVAKAIAISAALQEGKITPTSTLDVPASHTGPTSGLPRGGTRFHDAEVHGAETLTTAGILGKSSNMGSIMIGEKMPKETFYRYLCKFGLCETSGVGFPGESAGQLARPSTWDAQTRSTITFGQGMAATAIQQASAFQTIANGGVRVPPKLVRAIDSGDGWRAPTDSRRATRVLDTKVASEMATMMQGVITHGATAPKAAVPGYKVAGKTGTAKRYDNKVGGYAGYVASFVGFAPADKPAYVVLVSVEDPAGIYGGEVAAPVFSDIMREVLSHEKVPPTGDQPRSPIIPFTPVEGRR